MIRHIVMVQPKPKSDAALQAVFADLSDLVERLDGCSGFCAGPNRDFENKSPDYPVGFTLDAADAGALSAYADHPDHKVLGGRLVALCENGAEGIIVFDIEVAH